MPRRRFRPARQGRPRRPAPSSQGPRCARRSARGQRDRAFLARSNASAFPSFTTMSGAREALCTATSPRCHGHDGGHLALVGQKRVGEHHGDQHDEHGAHLPETRRRAEGAGEQGKGGSAQSRQRHNAAAEAEHEDGGEAEALGKLREEDPHERLEGHVADEHHRGSPERRATGGEGDEHGRHGDERDERAEEDVPALVAAQRQKRHHNKHRGDAGGDEQQCLIFEGAAGQDGLNGGLAHDAQGHAEEEHRQSEAHHETRVIDGQRLEKELAIVEIEAHVATQHKQEGDFRKGNERACRAAPRKGDLV